MELGTISAVAGYLVKKFKAKAFYPGLPFLSVPIVTIWFMATQFEGSLLFSPSSKVSALQLQSAVNPGGSTADYSATILVIPSGADSFVLPFRGKRAQGARLSVSTKELRWNRKRIELYDDALSFENNWIGTSYPLTLVLEGGLQEKIRFSSRKEESIPKLELSTSDSVWIALGAVLSAIFGIGLAAGFVKDSSEILKEEAGSNV